ncbi:MAG: DUF3857 domain-containing protein [Bacteroidia bacterium]|nr:DUF3857 domain-containing protein [Bacteroidia bacterium]
MDTSAEAIILGDWGTSYLEVLNNQWKMVFERQVRIKILKKSGLDWANGNIPLYSPGSTKPEKIQSIRGMTYNLVDGKVETTKLTSQEIYEEDLSENYRVKKFALPNAREGSIVEYHYSIISDNFFSIREWNFQTTIPVLESSYSTFIPEYFTHKIMGHSYLDFSKNSQKTTSQIIGLKDVNGHPKPVNVKVREWEIKNLPAFLKEPFMTCDQDYMAHLEFEIASYQFPGEMPVYIVKSWDDLRDRLKDYDMFGVQINKNFYKSELEAALNGKGTELEKMKAVSELVSRKMEWNGSNDLYSSDGLKTAWERGGGNSADLNLLLISMLKEAGLKAHPVILSTRNNGKAVQDFPMLRQFNYVIAQVEIEDESILLDATEPSAPHGILPLRVLNGPGLLLDPQNTSWVEITPRLKSQEAIQGKFEMDANGKLTGWMEISQAGLDGLYARTLLDEKGEDEFLIAWKKRREGWASVEMKLPESREKEDFLKHSCVLTSQSLVKKAGPLLYLTPMLTEARQENPFKSQNRIFPVDFGAPWKEIYSAQITLPEGFVADEIPEGVYWALPEKAAVYRYHLEILENTLSVTSSLEIRDPVITPNLYPSLREFFDRVVAKQGEQLVLKRVEK